MRINITNAVTVAQLRAQIKNASDDQVLTFFKIAKSKQQNECWCGCGGVTKGKFVPGHDSKFHSLAKQVARGLEEMPETFVNEDAKADFMKWHDAEVPMHAERVAAKEAKRFAREQAKAEAKEAKETLKAELAG